MGAYSSLDTDGAISVALTIELTDTRIISCALPSSTRF